MVRDASIVEKTLDLESGHWALLLTLPLNQCHHRWSPNIPSFPFPPLLNYKVWRGNLQALFLLISNYK